MSDKRCSRCSGPQKEGFILDATHNGFAIGHWAEGVPTFWFLKFLKTKGRRKFPMQSWRCSKCGLLETYANAPGDS
ncbi:MAG: hypothetical protein ABI639_11280 [Thermoanaerobaculia bacterium]